MSEIRNCWYRVSIKALVLDVTRTKFLITKEENGLWELPGGGLDWGFTPQEDLPREIDEEMGLKISWIANHPSYFLTGERLGSNHAAKGEKIWIANVLYEAELESLDFTPSDECVEIMFVDKEDIVELNVFSNVSKLAELFDANKHKR